MDELSAKLKQYIMDIPKSEYVPEGWVKGRPECFFQAARLFLKAGLDEEEAGSLLLDMFLVVAAEYGA